MSFVNPAMLWFLSLVSIPIIIYIINRQRFKRIWWAAMEFLLRAMKKNRRRIRIENLLLLIIRTLIVLLAVLAVARPQIGAAFLGPLARKSRNFFFLLDNSYSMGYKVGATSAFERAKKRLKDILNHTVQDGDIVIFAVMNEGLENWNRFHIGGEEDRQRLKDAINETVLSHKGTNYILALRQLFFGKKSVIERLEAAKERENIVVIATDCQQCGWFKEGDLTSKEVRSVFTEVIKRKVALQIIDVSVEEPINVSVDDLRLESQGTTVGLKSGVPLIVTFHNRSSRQLDGTVTLMVDDMPQETRRVTLPQKKATALKFECSFPDKGVHYVTVKWDADPLAADDFRYLVVEAREKIDLLVVNGRPSPDPTEDEVVLVESALRALQEEGAGGLPVFDYEVRTVGEFEELASAGRLRNYQVILLANVPSMTVEAYENLKEFVKAGGGVLYFMGDRVDPITLNKTMYEDGKGLLPFECIDIFPKQRHPKERYQVVLDAEGHPALVDIEAYATTILDKPRVERYIRVKEEPRRDVTVLLRLTGQNRSPILVERKFGRGSAIFAFTSASVAWNNWGCLQFLPILLYDTLYYLSSHGITKRNYKVGEQLWFAIQQEKIADTQVEIYRPGEAEPLTGELSQPKRLGAPYELLFRKTDKSGVYRIVFNPRQDRWEDYAAFNLDTEESDVANRVYAGTLKEAYPNLMVRVERPGRGKKAAKDITAKAEIWRTLITLVLLLLAVEMIAALLIGRRHA